jgi:hypothetical protein
MADVVIVPGSVIFIGVSTVVPSVSTEPDNQDITVVPGGSYDKPVISPGLSQLTPSPSTEPDNQDITVVTGPPQSRAPIFPGLFTTAPAYKNTNPDIVRGPKGDGDPFFGAPSLNARISTPPDNKGVIANFFKATPGVPDEISYQNADGEYVDVHGNPVPPPGADVVFGVTINVGGSD